MEYCQLKIYVLIQLVVFMREGEKSCTVFALLLFDGNILGFSWWTDSLHLWWFERFWTILAWQFGAFMGSICFFWNPYKPWICLVRVWSFHETFWLAMVTKVLNCGCRCIVVTVTLLPLWLLQLRCHSRIRWCSPWF